MKGQWSWFVKTIVGVSKALVTAFSFWVLDDITLTLKLQESYGKLLADESEAVWPVLAWVLWPSSEAGTTLCYKNFTVRLPKWYPEPANVRTVLAFLCVFLTPAETPGVRCAPRRILISAQAPWQCIPASTFGPAHENKHWQTIDTRNKQAISHNHYQLFIITLSYDRSKGSSKASSAHRAIQYILVSLTL